jgi:hypothetical protein
MASSSATFPLFNVRKDTTSDFLAKARALAKEENVSLPKYLAGMIKHMLLGHDLSKIHFFQDGSGDTYNEDVLDRMHEEAMADEAAGELKTFSSAEEGLAYLAEIRKAVESRREID